jgi:hypothetical protein
MCHFDVRHGRYCNAEGNMPACALCPRSPTYAIEPHHIAHQTPPGVHDPHCPACRNVWNGDPPPTMVNLTGWVDERGGHATPCTLCRLPTTWISPKGTRCHPSCATTHLRRRTTPPVS